jgi:hypothetical protein
MNKILQQLLIISSVFLIILWFQIQDDRKHNKKRNGYYDMYKFPILISAIIGLLLNFYCDNISELDIFIQPTITPETIKNNAFKSMHENKYNMFEVDTGKFE